MKRRNHVPHQQGYTLIELMVALLLGLFLLGGILQIFINTKQTFKIQDALSRIQENGRFAMQFLSQDIRATGYRGVCVTDATIATNLFTGGGSFLQKFSTVIQGFNAETNTWSPALDSSITSAIHGSDVISIRRADQTAYTVQTHSTSSLFLQLSSASTLCACDNAIVTDCSTAAVFHVTRVDSVSATNDKLFYEAGACSGASTGTIGNDATTTMASNYSGGMVYLINTISYYIRNNPNNTPSLYRKQGTNNAEELVEGIAQMQILYGVDTDTTPDGTANYYVIATSVPDWAKVVSVRLSLLAISPEDNITDNPVTYTYNGNTVTPTDRRLRKVFTSTIALRNRLS